MTHNVENWQALAVRLEKLEKQNRRIRGIGIALLVLAAALVLMGQTPGHRTVEANEFVLKDASGTVRGRWSVVEAFGPKFVLLDATGKERVLLNVLDTGAGLILRDASGRDRAGLVATVNGPGLNLTDANGKSRVFVFADDTEDSFGVGLHDEKGLKRAALTFYNGTPKLALLDAERKERVGIELTEGRPLVRLWDQQGKPRVAIGAPVPGNLGTGLVVLGERGKSSVRVGFSTEEPMVGLTDESGIPRLMLLASQEGGDLALTNRSAKIVAELGENEDGSVRLSLNDAYGSPRIVMRMGPQGPMLGVVDENQRTLWKAP